MNGRNFLSSGNYVIPVPIGLPITLQYNANKILERVYRGIISGAAMLLPDVSDQLLPALLGNHTVPAQLTTGDGTTWVQGVLYTSNPVLSAGKLPESLWNKGIAQYLTTPSMYNFFAGGFQTTYEMAAGAAAVRRWLASSGFNVLPGSIVPADVQSDTLHKMFDVPSYQFAADIASMYFIYDLHGVTIVRTNFLLHCVQAVEQVYDSCGFLYADVELYNQWEDLRWGLNTIWQHNLHPTNHIVVDADTSELIYVFPSLIPTPNNCVCRFCGKPLKFTQSQPAMCENPQCCSVMYPHIQQLLSVLSLPELSFESYKTLTKASAILDILDVFKLPEYSTQLISVDLVTALAAIIPQHVAQRSSLSILINHCNNSPATLQYYLDHPQDISTDLVSSGAKLSELNEWLHNDINLNRVKSLLALPTLQLTEIIRKFDGPQIFRDRTILLTGKFRHGDHAEVAAILRSYGANIVYDTTSQVDGVVFGSLMENVDGSVLKYARAHSIPIMEEDGFFAEYDIDSDIAQNL